MTIGITKNTSIIGVEKEVTEGTYLAPTAATSYIQPLSGGFEASPKRELIDRNILTSSIGKATPRLGIASAAGALPVEFRASGVEGGDVDFAALLESALGAKRSIAANKTSKAAPAHTVDTLQIEDADIAAFNVGDIICIKETAKYHVAAIVSKTSGAGTATITVTPGRIGGGIFPASVVISKSQMYFTANTAHPALSLSYYWGNQIRAAIAGAKITSLAIDNYAVGQVAAFNFGFDALSYVETDGVAPHTPTFDTGLPPIILSACVFKDGVSVDINKLGLSLANTLSFMTSVCNSNGRISSRVTERKVTGSINPYKDDTSVANFTGFNAGTEFSILARAYNPSAVAGEFTLGSIVGIWLPKCIVTEYKVADQDGILTDELTFQAVRGSDGSTEEMYLGLI